MLNAVFHRTVDRFVQREIPALEFLQLRHEKRILFQPSASGHQLLVVPIVDVQDPDGQIETGFLLFAVFIRERVRELQNLLLFRSVLPVVEDDAPWGREPYQAAAIDVPAVLSHQRLEFRRQVDQEPQRKVGAEGALVLVQVQRSAQQEGHIVVHGHVNHVVQGDDLQGLFVPVVRAVQRIVELQQRFPVMLEDITEEPVLHVPVAEEIPDGQPVEPPLPGDKSHLFHHKSLPPSEMSDRGI